MSCPLHRVTIALLRVFHEAFRVAHILGRPIANRKGQLCNMLIGIDIGGTFTDIVVLEPRTGRLSFLKTPSTPQRLEEGVVRGLEVLREDMGLRIEDVRRVIHGSTVATNALLEGKWARTALITTEGFRDVLEIGRQNRPHIYDLTAQRPRPIVPRELRFEVSERLDYHGSVIRPLDESSVDELVEQLEGGCVQAVAVCLLFSYVNAGHERTVREILKRRLSLPITVSSDIIPEFREYERTSTTVVNASLRPVIGDYLERLEKEGRRLGLKMDWQIMQSNAGITSSRGAEAQPVRIVLSGPAAGVEGARLVGEQAGFPDLITLDMGGTSTDVSLINKGRVSVTTDGEIAGHPIKVPMVDIHTIGAGGGSIAWVDRGGALRVGPKSAGADPGPACYSRGGREPTVTDAHLLLGRLSPENATGGWFDLDRSRAENATRERVADPLEMDIETAAEGMLRVADANMERALRLISVERGHDPREFALLAFGGTGPLHAVGLARMLGIRKVLVPATAGVLSALGLVGTELAHDEVQSIVRSIDALDPEEVNAVYARLKTTGRNKLLSDGVDKEEIAYRPSADLRYRGESHEIFVEFADCPISGRMLGELAAAFHDKHQLIYGHAAPEEPVELVNLRLRAIGAVENVELSPIQGGSFEQARQATRSVHFPRHGWLQTGIFARDLLPAGASLTGPAIVEGRESTVLLPPGSSATVDRIGTLIIECDKEEKGR